MISNNDHLLISPHIKIRHARTEKRKATREVHSPKRDAEMDQSPFSTNCVVFGKNQDHFLEINLFSEYSITVFTN